MRTAQYPLGYGESNKKPDAKMHGTEQEGRTRSEVEMSNHYLESANYIKSRNGGCFGISCPDCPNHIEPYIPNFGYECSGGGQGNYSEILKKVNKFLVSVSK